MKFNDIEFLQQLRSVMFIPKNNYFFARQYLSEVESRKEIEGFKISDIRAFLRHMFQAMPNPMKPLVMGSQEELSECTTMYRTTELLDICQRYGFCKTESKKDEYTFSLTVRGLNLIHSTSGNITRKAATKNLLWLLDRVDSYNKNPEAVKRISRVTLFGSFLTADPSLEKIGDVDLMIRYETDDEDRYREVTEKRMAEWEEKNPDASWQVALHAPSRIEYRLFMPRRPNHFSFFGETDFSLSRSNIWTVPHLILFEDRPKRMLGEY